MISVKVNQRCPRGSAPKTPPSAKKALTKSMEARGLGGNQRKMYAPRRRGYGDNRAQRKLEPRGKAFPLPEIENRFNLCFARVTLLAAGFDSL